MRPDPHAAPEIGIAPAGRVRPFPRDHRVSWDGGTHRPGPRRRFRLRRPRPGKSEERCGTSFRVPLL